MHIAPFCTSCANTDPEDVSNSYSGCCNKRVSTDAYEAAELAARALDNAQFAAARGDAAMINHLRREAAAFAALNPKGN